MNREEKVAEVEELSGKFAKAKNPDKGWINWRNYKKSLINWSQIGEVILFTHDKDWADTRKTLSFLTEFENIKFFASSKFPAFILCSHRSIIIFPPFLLLVKLSSSSKISPNLIEFRLKISC